MQSAKEKETTLVYKTLHRKQNIEKHEPHTGNIIWLLKIQQYRLYSVFTMLFLERTTHNYSRDTRYHGHWKHNQNINFHIYTFKDSKA